MDDMWQEGSHYSDFLSASIGPGYLEGEADMFQDAISSFQDDTDLLDVDIPDFDVVSPQAPPSRQAPPPRQAPSRQAPPDGKDLQARARHFVQCYAALYSAFEEVEDVTLMPSEDAIAVVAALWFGR